MKHNQSIDRRLGVSLREEWLDCWDELNMDRFGCFELIPSLIRLDLDNNWHRKLQDKNLYLHLTDTAIFDHPIQFNEKLRLIEEAFGGQHFTFKSISLHHCYESLYPQNKLLGMFPPVASSQYLSFAKKNITSLYNFFGVDSQIAIENLSLPFRTPLVDTIFADFFNFASELNLEILLDVTNAANSCHNSNTDLRAAVAKALNSKISYCHYGGYFEIEQVRLDSHDGYIENTELNSVCRDLLVKGYSLIYEQDFRLTDINYCRRQLDMFYDRYFSDARCAC